MKAEEVEALLKQWECCFKSLCKVRDEFVAITCACPESHFLTVMFFPMHAYTEQLAHRLGDQASWLEWYLWEDECGARELEAGYDGNMRPIRNIKDLAWLLTY